ncbi:MAG: serine hydroxymethyltransferase [Candidatus Poribacteria bacterium]|nr:serine hydroxymethyltransferase [Candidatus Poribacteria bacterium]
MNPNQKIEKLTSLLNKHHEYRETCLNLIASENTPSPLVEELFDEKLARRYGNYSGIDLYQRNYKGNRYIAEIEAYTQELAKELFNAKFVDFRPLSGNIAGIATTFALAEPGDIALEVHNGHRYANKLASSPLKVELQSIPIPWDGLRSNIDLPATIELIELHKPKIVNIGSGVFLFPQPVAELKNAMRQANPDSYLIYDAAHVIGLIAGGRFQSPFAEGADVIISSTHKTLAGPQGGIVLTNDKSIAERIGKTLYPLLMSNHHLSRLPALAGTFVEWMVCGAAHADAIVANAKALGQALADRGVPMLGAKLGFTESHTLIPIVDTFGDDGNELANQLEACHIIAGAAGLPPEVGTSGLRFGVQEVTRWGMTTEDAPDIADCIVAALSGESSDTVKPKVARVAQRFNTVQFALK